MTPRGEQALERLALALERQIDQRLDVDVDRLKIEAVQLRADLNHVVEVVERLEDATENTKDVYVDDLKKKLKERDESGDKWVRYVVATFVSLIFMSGSAFLGWLLAHAH
jgi:hypothetical protein